MTLEEQKLFLEYAKKTYYGNIFEVALSTGMRNGELRALEWSDIDFKNKMLHVTGTLIYTKGDIIREHQNQEAVRGTFLCLIMYIRY